MRRVRRLTAKEESILHQEVLAEWDRCHTGYLITKNWHKLQEMHEQRVLAQLNGEWGRCL